MESLPRTINCVGTIRVVSTKYAYVDTAKGTVFCPLSAAIPHGEIVPDMSKRYTAGDTVRVDAVQQDSKNNCPYRAKKMRHTAQGQISSEIMAAGDPSSSYGTSCTAAVGYIDVAFVIADSLELGCIFVPRPIFGALEKEYPELQTGDNLYLIVRPQPEQNNCKWLAISVQEVIKSSFSANPVFAGSGIVQRVDQMTAEVYSAFHGVIICPILTWMGGDLGINAIGLDEILRPGDQVAFEAINRGEINRAIRWSFLNDLKKRPVTKIDTYTQSMPTLQDCVIRLLRPQLEEMKDKFIVKMFLDSVNDDDSG